MAVNVVFAAYGALRDGDPLKEEAVEVTGALQALINDPNFRGTVVINNQNMGGDPSPNVVKHFGALIDVDGQRRALACQEGQEIAILV